MAGASNLDVCPVPVSTLARTLTTLPHAARDRDGAAGDRRGHKAELCGGVQAIPKRARLLYAGDEVCVFPSFASPARTRASSRCALVQD
jgi:hypothetical protein